MFKNLTKVQVQIEELAKKMPCVTEAQFKWAQDNHEYFQWIKEEDTHVCCPNCKEELYFGGQLPWKEDKKYKERKTICPHCGAQLRVVCTNNDKRRRNYLQERFFQVLSVVGDWQVTREFYMRRYTYIKKENTPWELYECCQAWSKPSDKNVYFRSLPKIPMGSWFFNPYSLWSVKYEHDGDNDTYHAYRDAPHYLEPRKPNGSNYFDTTAIAPNPQILPQYRRMGLNADFLRRNIVRTAIGWFQKFSGKNYDSMYETLIKAKAYKFMYKADRAWRCNMITYYNAWKIANRHHYKIANMDEWIDTIDLLHQCGMDCRNPVYICPKDAHALHQQLLAVREKKMKEAERKMERERDMERLQEAVKNFGEEYAKRIAKYLDMDIHDDTLHIVVLSDIPAFKEEADHLCHCVFRCKYYLHTDSLILSARDAKGKRWETIEVSLTDYSIVQAYGYGDEHTEKHKEILDLVESNMWQIKQRCTNGKRMSVAS